jgi:peptidoglycan hydrolase FlgJ
MKSLPLGDAASGLSFDAGALASLKQQAQRSPKEALSAAASQFEALFVQNLLKAMREALPQDGPLSSDSMRAYTSMFDAQLAQEIAKRGLGLGKMLERQLAPALEAGDPSAAKALSTSMGIDTTNPSGIRMPLTGARAKSTVSAIPATAAGGGTPTTVATNAATSSTSTRKVPEHVRSFLETMRPHAEAAARIVGVPADVLLAQAGLETGWGKHQPQTASGETSHNLFGVKAGKRWNGAVAVATTTEYVAGALTRTVDKFRAYSSYTDAFADFGKLLLGNARYADALANVHDAAAYARGLQKGGYATDPRYADKLTQAIALVTGHAGSTAPPATQVWASSVDNRSHQA